MNEKIKKILEESTYEVFDNDPYNGSPIFEHYEVDQEKFAKLIVKECLGIYSKIDNGNLHIGTDNYIEAVSKHFGIE